ncbi:hypothetical protein ABW19_dt0207841 [Dactylella cylindrospora]|nr:hypothetical protein ABW19_dt0207841 [Dactylella cylindrospora]
MGELLTGVASGAILELSKAAFRGATSFLSAVDANTYSPQTARLAAFIYYKLIVFIKKSGIKDGELKNGYEICPGQVKWILEEINKTCADIGQLRKCYDVESVSVEEAFTGLGQNPQMQTPTIRTSQNDRSWKKFWQGGGKVFRRARYEVTGDRENLKEILFKLDMLVTQLGNISPALSELALEEGWRNEILDNKDIEGLQTLTAEVEERFQPIIKQLRIKKMNEDQDVGSSPRNIDGVTISDNYMRISTRDTRSILEKAPKGGKHWIASIKDVPATFFDAKSPGLQTFKPPDALNAEAIVIVERKIVQKTSPSSGTVSASEMSWKRLALLCYSHNVDSMPSKAGPTMLQTIGRAKDSDRDEDTMLLLYKIPEMDKREQAVEFITLHKLLRMLNAEGKPLSRSLDSRLLLAKSVIGWVYRYHQMGWMHKHVCASNILLLRYEGEDLMQGKLRPYIVGFDYARQINAKAAADMSEKYIPQADDEEILYRHPDYKEDASFHPKFDLFSVGIILWEIGLWRPGSRRTIEPRGPLTNWRRWIEKETQKLEFAVGIGYSRVVEACLSGEYESPQTGEILSVSSDYTALELQLVMEMERVCSSVRKGS